MVCYTLLLIYFFLLMKRLFLVTCLLLAACKPSTDITTKSVDVIERDTSSNDAIQGTGSVMQTAVYTSYAPDVLANGQVKVLFFSAAWCPICREADGTLQSWFNAQQPTLSVYKADYDTETTLKAKYGVTYQHTFVLVDGQGNEIQKIEGPSDAALKALVGA